MPPAIATSRTTLTATSCATRRSSSVMMVRIVSCVATWAAGIAAVLAPNVATADAGERRDLRGERHECGDDGELGLLDVGRRGLARIGEFPAQPDELFDRAVAPTDRGPVRGHRLVHRSGHTRERRLHRVVATGTDPLDVDRDGFPRVRQPAQRCLVRLGPVLSPRPATRRPVAIRGSRCPSAAPAQCAGEAGVGVLERRGRVPQPARPAPVSTSVRLRSAARAPSAPGT